MQSNFDYYTGWNKGHMESDWNKDHKEYNWKKDYDCKKDFDECDFEEDHKKHCWEKDQDDWDCEKDFDKCDWKKDQKKHHWKKDHDDCPWMDDHEDWKKEYEKCYCKDDHFAHDEKEFHKECDFKKDHHKFDDKKFDKHKKSNFARLCAKFADILESEILPSPRGVCVVTRTRDLKVKIKRRPTRSPLVLNALFSFECPDKEGRTLNLGETVILQEEINPFIKALKMLGIKVTALHNHWLFENPRLFYIHFLSVDEPLIFAKKVAKAFEILEDC